MPLITTHPTAAFPFPPHELLHDLPHDPSFDLAHGLPPSGAHRPSLRNPDDAGVPPLARFKAPATCGELIQGCLDGHDFLVNCPIDLYAYAELQPTSTPGISVSDVAHHGKIDHGIALLTDRLADHWGRPWGAAHGGAQRDTERGERQGEPRGDQDDEQRGIQWAPRRIAGPDRDTDLRPPPACQVRVRSHIPRGKGMASSSADLSAALQAVCAGCGFDLSPQDFTELVVRIEPSDCVHLPGIAHVNHLSGALYDSLPAPGDLSVVVVDCGGEIDTLDFDRERARDVYRIHADAVAGMLATLRLGLTRRDERMIAAAATQSAALSQSILPKPQFEELLRLSLGWGALGLNCAHSGTVLGVLHRTSDGLAQTLIERIDAHFGRTVSVLGNHHIISGGCLEY